MDNLSFLGFLFGPLIMISFLVTVLILPHWIRRAKLEKMVGKDIHKLDKRKVAEGGGIAVLVGFVISVLLYIGIKTFIFSDNRNMVEILGLLGVVSIASIVGIFDDLLGWKKGLSKRSRLVMIFFSAIPLMVLNVGQHTVSGIDFGVFYPLFLIPLGVIGATTTFNFLAGYNGLESSQGILVLTALSIVNFISGNLWLSLIGMCMVASLVGFFLFNKYPAKVFPGDILTYCVGALIACLAILGNIEKIALFFFIPYIIEVLLKMRGKLEIESFGEIQKDGSIKLRQKGIYGLEHFAIWILIKVKKKAYEWEVPLVINLIQLGFIIAGFWLFI